MNITYTLIMKVITVIISYELAKLVLKIFWFDYLDQKEISNSNRHERELERKNHEISELKFIKCLRGSVFEIKNDLDKIMQSHYKVVLPRIIKIIHENEQN